MSKVLSLVFISLIICINSHAESVRLTANRPVLRIVDAQKVPIVHAEVMIGTAENHPFPHNIFKTDEGGEIEKPLEWSQELPVTIHSTGYVLTTHMPVSPSHHKVLPVYSRKQEKPVSVGGRVSGYGRIRNGDKMVDFSLVLPALTRKQLINLDTSSLLSPEEDTLDLPFSYQLGIPSNLSIPRQRESYKFFPVRLNKPNYRFVTREHGPKRMTALRGRFPIQETVSAFRDGKQLLEIVNYIMFLSGGQLDVDVQGSVKRENIRVNEWKLDKKFYVRAPQYGQNQAMLSLSLMENVHGEMLPMDIKMIESQEVKKLKSRQSNNNQYTLSVLLNKGDTLEDQLNFNQASLVLNKTSEEVRPTFLNMIEPPKMEGSVLTLSPPEAIEGVFPVATYLILAQVESSPEMTNGVSVKTYLWEVFHRSWIAQISLPDVPIQLNQGKRYIWEVIYLGSEGEIQKDKEWSFEDITHATRNVLEI